MKLIRIGLDRQAEVQAIKQARASTEVVTRKSGSDGCAACWKPRALRDSFVCPPSHPLLSLSPPSPPVEPVANGVQRISAN